MAAIEQLMKILLGLMLWTISLKSGNYLAILITMLCLLEFVPTVLAAIEQLVKILLGLMLWTISLKSGNYLAILITMLCLLELVPTVLAAGLEQSSFPDIPFQLFSTFV
jgi:uncharacterized protein (DUF1499 family)